MLPVPPPYFGYRPYSATSRPKFFSSAPLQVGAVGAAFAHSTDLSRQRRTTFPSTASRSLPCAGRGRQLRGPTSTPLRNGGCHKHLQPCRPRSRGNVAGRPSRRDCASISAVGWVATAGFELTPSKTSDWPRRRRPFGQVVFAAPCEVLASDPERSVRRTHG